MVKKQHKVLSIVLCLMLAVSAVFAGTVGAFAASGDTVYCRLNNGWGSVYAYMWSADSGNNAAWPGVKMTEVESGVYSYQLTGDFDMIIFNNGSGGNGNQTSDLSYAGNGKIYDLSSGTWSTYVEVPTDATKPTQATGATTATTATEPPVTGEGITVYLKNEAGWSNVNCYMWSDGAGNNGAWPGKAMTNIGDDVYMYTSSTAFENCIFNNGSSQTSDLTAMDGYIFNNKTNTWSVYDTSDLQVKSYSVDPSSNIYIGTDVNVSAVAQNKNGAAVSYKFSVTNEMGGTSVISDYSPANSVVWTPSAAGTYTINFDFKDGEGNENNRTLEVEVTDDSTLIKPVIKSVFPANLNLIKVNTPTTVSVKAGGGNTGTKLLFYKYVVTDPNGVENTPYYTLNSTYTFTPNMIGEYEVNVYVQGSDNSTVSKTYNYTSTDGDVTNPTTKPTTQPTTATTMPTTVPTTAPTTVPTTAPTTSPTDPEPEFILGDVDGDGRVSIADATYIQKYLVNMTGYTNIDLKVADVDKDGRISIKDATAIQYMLVM